MSKEKNYVELLHTECGMSLREVARVSGYGSLSNLSRTFKDGKWAGSRNPKRELNERAKKHYYANCQSPAVLIIEGPFRILAAISRECESSGVLRVELDR